MEGSAREANACPARPFTYSDLPTDVLLAHVHFGAPAQNGGIAAFLCANVSAPPGTPPCPVNGGTVTGTIDAADVIGPSAQGIDPGEFAEVISAMRAGATYVNLHTEERPGGEIRGQLGKFKP